MLEPLCTGSSNSQITEFPMRLRSFGILTTLLVLLSAIGTTVARMNVPFGVNLWALSLACILLTAMAWREEK